MSQFRFGSSKKMSQNDDDSHKKRQNESADSAFIFCVGGAVLP